MWTRCLFTLLLFTAACGGGAGTGEDTGSAHDLSADAPLVTPEIFKFTAVANPANVLSWFVEWETDVATRTHLEVDCGPDYRQTFLSAVSFTDHEVFVMGLFEGATCTLEVHAGEGAFEAVETLVIEDIGPVPDDFPPLTRTFLAEADVYPGWTAWSLGHAKEGGTLRVFVVDHQGRFRWYHFGSDSLNAGAGAEIQQIDGGLLLAAAGPARLLGWDGGAFWEAPFGIHHDMRFCPWNEDHILFLGSSGEGCPTSEHTVESYDMVKKEKIWEWRVCEHYTPYSSAGGWSHLNTIEPFPGERAMLISMRNQDVMFRLDRDTGEIDWVLGWGGDFSMAPEDLFLRQHAPEILDNGEILVFDNGMAQSEIDRKGEDQGKLRPVSRVIQLALSFHEDGTPDEAHVTWEYLDPDLFAFARSEADRLPNGNTLITYSQLNEARDSWLREITWDKVTVWEIRSPPNWSTYRAERITPVYGEIRSQE